MDEMIDFSVSDNRESESESDSEEDRRRESILDLPWNGLDNRQGIQ